MTNKRLSPSIPEWMSELPDNAMMSAVEVAQIYGINRKSIGPSVDRGRIPECDFVTDRKSKRGGQMWALGKIRKHVKECVQ